MHHTGSDCLVHIHQCRGAELFGRRHGDRIPPQRDLLPQQIRGSEDRQRRNFRPEPVHGSPLEDKAWHLCPRHQPKHWLAGDCKSQRPLSEAGGVRHESPRRQQHRNQRHAAGQNTHTTRRLRGAMGCAGCHVRLGVLEIPHWRSQQAARATENIENNS